MPDLSSEALSAVDSALSGFRVIEVAREPGAAFAGKLLADMGAEVIKVEEPVVGDRGRRRPPFPGGVSGLETSGFFLYLNTSKLSVTIALERPSGRQLAAQLIDSADVLIEDASPGELEEMSLGYPQLVGRNPRLVMVALTPFGQFGPHSTYRAHDLNIAHGGGEGYLLPRDPDALGRPPVRPGSHITSYTAGTHAALAVVSALFARESDGRGQFIDVSSQETAMAIDPVLFGQFTASGQQESRSTAKPFGGARLQCRDGFIAMYLGTSDWAWNALVEVMGAPSWSDRFATVGARLESAKELYALIEQWALAHTKEEIYDRALAAGCPLAPYETTEDLINSPQLAARGYFVTIDHPDAGPLAYPSAPYKMSETPWGGPTGPSAAPRLGQHNSHVFGDMLGHSEDQIAEWLLDGVI